MCTRSSTSLSFNLTSQTCFKGHHCTRARQEDLDAANWRTKQPIDCAPHLRTLIPTFDSLRWVEFFCAHPSQVDVSNPWAASTSPPRLWGVGACEATPARAKGSVPGAVGGLVTPWREMFQYVQYFSIILVVWEWNVPRSVLTCFNWNSLRSLVSCLLHRRRTGWFLGEACPFAGVQETWSKWKTVTGSFGSLVHLVLGFFNLDPGCTWNICVPRPVKL